MAQDQDFGVFLAKRGYSDHRYQALPRDQQQYLRNAWKMEAHAAACMRDFRARGSGSAAHSSEAAPDRRSWFVPVGVVVVVCVVLAYLVAHVRG